MFDFWVLACLFSYFQFALFLLIDQCLCDLGLVLTYVMCLPPLFSYFISVHIRSLEQSSL